MGQRDRRFVAMDIGASFVRTALLIEGGDGWRIEDRRARPWPARLSLDDQVSWLTRVAGDQAALAGAPANADGVGVSFAGAVDRDGLVARWPNRPEWVGIRLKAMLESGWGGAVAIDDDARCAARGELRCGAAAGFRHALVVTVGTGIGAGIILGGQLFRGPTGLAGDLGHIGMAGEPDGDGLCPCGRRGCVQMAASGRTIDALGAAGGVQDGRGLIAAANSGAGWALSALERCGRRLGDAAGNAAALLDSRRRRHRRRSRLPTGRTVVPRPRRRRRAPDPRQNAERGRSPGDARRRRGALWRGGAGGGIPGR